MKKYHISIVLLLVLNQTFAQNYYQFMEKNSIGYANTVFHTMNVLNLKNNKHTLTYQRVLNAHTTLLLNGSFVKAPCRFGFESAPTLAKYKTNQSGGTFITEGYHLLSGENYYKASAFELGLRKFFMSKGALAPYGRFFEMKLGYENLSQPANEKLNYYNSNGQPTTEKFTNIGMKNLTFLNIVTGIGSTRPIAKRISFTWVVSMTLPIGFWGDKTTEQLSVNGYRKIVLNSDEYYFESAKMTHTRNNVLNVSIGLNYSF